MEIKKKDKDKNKAKTKGERGAKISMHGEAGQPGPN